jgi:predicted ABC-type ATPase
MLSTPEMNIQRVRLRVIKGGHAVPEDKIRERWHKSLEQLPWFLNEADQAAIYDNSGSVPRLIGQKSNGVTMLDPSAPRPLQAVFHI